MDKRGRFLLINKKGTFTETFLGIVLITIVAIIVYAALMNQGVVPRLGVDAGGIISFTFEQLGKGVAILKDLVIPIGLDSNQQYIAFAVFLIIMIVGTRSLNSVFESNPLYGFALATLVAFIASKTLTPAIVKDYIGVSSVATAAAILGILPIMIFYKFVDSWKESKVLTRFFLWIFASALYFAIYYWVFNMQSLAWVYAILVLVTGIIEIFAPYLRQGARRRNRENLGRFMFMTHEDLATFETARDAAIKAAVTGRKSFKGVPKAPWEV